MYHNLILDIPSTPIINTRERKHVVYDDESLEGDEDDEAEDSDEENKGFISQVEKNRRKRYLFIP